MNKVVLPPLPDEFLMHPTQGECYTAAQLRAHALEVARVVLEAAAKAWNEYEDENTRAATFIRALEFTHG